MSTIDEWKIKDARKGVEGLITLLQAKDARIAQLEREFGEVQPVKSIPSLFPIQDIIWQKGKVSLHSFSDVKQHICPDRFTEFFEKWTGECEKIIEENKTAVSNNIALREKVMKLLTTLGFKEKNVEYKGRSIKRVETTAAWVVELYRAIPCTNYTIKDEYDRYLRAVQDWRKEIEMHARQEKIAQENLVKENERINTLAYLRVKYKLDMNSDQEEILEHLLSLNKYLYLAHYLEKNRGDWNDGASYAKFGLKFFNSQTSENDTDDEIYAEISDLVSNFEDGWVFRDCKYNYDVLFSMVPTDLMEDYGKLTPFVNS